MKIIKLCRNFANCGNAATLREPGRGFWCEECYQQQRQAIVARLPRTPARASDLYPDE
jgi:hypothetical protein